MVGDEEFGVASPRTSGGAKAVAGAIPRVLQRKTSGIRMLSVMYPTKKDHRLDDLFSMVGDEEFESPTSSTSMRRSSQLS